MAERIEIKGRDKIHSYFKKQKCAYWKLLAMESRKVIQVNATQKDFDKSFQDFYDLLESIDPNGCYILELFAFTPGEKVTLTKPYCCVTFSIDENYIAPGSSIASHQEAVKKDSDFTGKMTLDSHFHLIGENARLIAAEAFQNQRIKELEKRIADLEEDNDHLSGIIDEYEEEEEEEAAEQEKITGQPETPTSIISNFLKENGKDIVGLLKGKLSPKVDINAYQPPQEDRATVNGVGDHIQLPDINIIVKQLYAIDPLLHEHLFKLLLIGQQQPETFKLLIGQLDSF